MKNRRNDKSNCGINVQVLGIRYYDLYINHNFVHFTVKVFFNPFIICLIVNFYYIKALEDILLRIFKIRPKKIKSS